MDLFPQISNSRRICKIKNDTIMVNTIILYKNMSTCFDREFQKTLRLMSKMHERGLILHNRKLQLSLWKLYLFSIQMSSKEKKESRKCIQYIKNIIDSPYDDMYKSLFARRMLRSR